jgi:hypothetical protein
VIVVTALAGFGDIVEHPNAVTTGIEAIAFRISRRFINSSFLSSRREDCILCLCIKLGQSCLLQQYLDDLNTNTRLRVLAAQCL